MLHAIKGMNGRIIGWVDENNEPVNTSAVPLEFFELLREYNKAAEIIVEDYKGSELNEEIKTCLQCFDYLEEKLRHHPVMTEVQAYMLSQEATK